MKTVAKINPEQEYENAKKIIDLASKDRLSEDSLSSLDSSVDNLITAARVLIEREERRRGRRNPPKENPQPKGRSKGEERASLKKLPSDRYPHIEVKEVIMRADNPPQCPCCHQSMKESGLFDTSEKLEVIPKSYLIERQKRVKYNCGSCHGGMINTPTQQSIVPTSNYGDSFIIDVALSKYCDLIPIERYTAMAGRDGLMDLPPQSLIGLTHHLANFLWPVLLKIKNEVLAARVLLADETPHKMLEGDTTKNWYLWGFFCSYACYFEVHNTRSGDIVKNFLKESQASHLLSDGYYGYGRAIREINEEEKRQIIEVFCNAHAYRYFEDAGQTWKSEAEKFLNLYGEIYKLESEKKSASKELQLELRKKMIPYFEEIKLECEKLQNNCMPASSLEKSINYFLNHYEGLTLCTGNIEIDLDNNFSERSLRSLVVGRKTWYGNHSKRGALTSAALFSVVQSCLVNKVNPRHYFPWIIEQIHRGKNLLTPYEYSQFKEIQ
jgi:transposase